MYLVGCVVCNSVTIALEDLDQTRVALADLLLVVVSWKLHGLDHGLDCLFPVPFLHAFL